MATEYPLFVLVPGIMHTPVHFELLEASLKSKGYDSISVALPNIGTSAASAVPGADTEAVRTVIQDLVTQKARDVVLMCHSFGGMPGCQAVNGYEKEIRAGRGEKGGIVRVVFLNAFIVKEDESALDALIRTAQAPPPWIDTEPANDAVYVPNMLAPEYLFNDLIATDAERWAAALLPIAANHQTQKVTNGCWSSKVPKTYISSDNDKALFPKTQQGMLDQVRDSTWSTREISSGHSPFLSQPDAFAELLIEESQH